MYVCVLNCTSRHRLVFDTTGTHYAEQQQPLALLTTVIVLGVAVAIAVVVVLAVQRLVISPPFQDCILTRNLLRELAVCFPPPVSPMSLKKNLLKIVLVRSLTV